MPIELPSPLSPHLPKSSNRSSVLKDVKLRDSLPVPLLQSLPAQPCRGTGQPITAGFPLPKRALETAGQHLITLATAITLLPSETQEPPCRNPSFPWWWRRLYPQGRTLESHIHTSSARAKGRAQCLRLNPSLSSPSRKNKKRLCHIIGCWWASPHTADENKPAKQIASYKQQFSLHFSSLSTTLPPLPVSAYTRILLVFQSRDGDCSFIVNYLRDFLLRKKTK